MFFFAPLWDTSHMLEFIHERLIHTKWRKKSKRNGRRWKRHGNLFSAQDIRVRRGEHWQRSETRSIIFFSSFTQMYTVCMSLVYMSYLIKVWSKVSRETNIHNVDECLSNEIWKLWKDLSFIVILATSEVFEANRLFIPTSLPLLRTLIPPLVILIIISY